MTDYRPSDWQGGPWDGWGCAGVKDPWLKDYRLINQWRESDVNIDRYWLQLGAHDGRPWQEFLDDQWQDPRMAFKDGHIYIMYAMEKPRYIYIGSSRGTVQSRKQWHGKSAFRDRETSLLYCVMRSDPGFEKYGWGFTSEADLLDFNKMALVWVRNVALPRFRHGAVPDTQRSDWYKTMLEYQERQFIAECIERDRQSALKHFNNRLLNSKMLPAGIRPPFASASRNSSVKRVSEHSSSSVAQSSSVASSSSVTSSVGSSSASPDDSAKRIKSMKALIKSAVRMLGLPGSVDDVRETLEAALDM